MRLVIFLKAESEPWQVALYNIQRRLRLDAIITVTSWKLEAGRTTILLQI